MAKSSAKKRGPDLKQAAIDFISAKIAARTEGYRPGQFLTELGVADQLTAALGRKKKVSRVPVREAFVDLAAKGFLVTHANVGTQIRQLQENDLADLLRSRQLLEEQVATELARRPALSVERARAINGQLDAISKVAAARGIDPQMCSEFIRQDSEFHAALAEIAELGELATTLRRIRQLLLLAVPDAPPGAPLILREDGMAHVVREHELILAAVRPAENALGDEGQARAAVRRHIAAAADRWSFNIKVEPKLAELFAELEPCPPGELVDLVLVRAYIETLVARDLAEHGGSISQAREFNAEMAQIARRVAAGERRPNDEIAFTSYDLRLHLAMIGASRYGFLLEALRHIWRRTIDYVRFPADWNETAEHMRTVCAEHNKLLNAISTVQFASTAAEKATWLKNTEDAARNHFRQAFERWTRYNPDKLRGYVLEIDPAPPAQLRVKPAPE